MPRMSGTELFLRLELKRSDLSVLYTSGYPNVLSGSGELGPSMPFTQKPFSAATLVERAHQILAARPTAV